VPIVTTGSYRSKADHYWQRARVCLVVLVITQSIYWSLILNRLYGPDNAGDLLGGAFGFDCVFVASGPAILLLLNQRKAKLFERPHDFHVQTLVFEPSKHGEPAPKITVTFQWPKEFNEERDGSGNKKPPSIPIEQVNIKARLQADVTAALIKYYERFAVLMGDTNEAVEAAIKDEVEAIANQTRVPVLKYDCIRIDPPAKPEKKEPKTAIDGYELAL
jgi:hypothetical protein